MARRPRPVFRPNLLQLEDRAVPSGTPVSADPVPAGQAPNVVVRDADGLVVTTIAAYEPGMTAGVRVAVYDLTGDGVVDIVTAPGVGGGPRVKVFDGMTFAPVADYYAYDESFRGGVWVAAGPLGGGDVGVATGAGEGGGPHVRVLTPAGVPVVGFFAGDPDWRTGVEVALAAGPDGTAVLTATAGGEEMAFDPRVGARAKAPAGPPAVPPGPFDANGDGRADGLVMDQDGDGRADTVDLDGDGLPDAVLLDLNGDGVPDAFGYDVDRDGDVDLVGYDTDGDGRPDSLDIDYDGVPGTGLSGAEDPPARIDLDGDGFQESLVIDLNGDGVPDGYVLDEDEDGRGDPHDWNGDGQPDGVGVDLDGDGDIDTLGFDFDGDGIPDGFGVDRNGDRRFGGIDFDGDGDVDFYPQGGGGLGGGGAGGGGFWTFGGGGWGGGPPGPGGGWPGYDAGDDPTGTGTEGGGTSEEEEGGGSSDGLWVDLLADTNVDYAFTSADGEIEDDDLGKVVFINSDDDNGDAVADADNQGAVAHENDLAGIFLIADWRIGSGEIRLSVSGDTTALRLWANADRTGAISTSTPTTFAFSTSGIYSHNYVRLIYAEGLDLGLATIRLELLDANGAVYLTNDVPVADDLNVRLADFELDVTDNVSVGDPGDGFWDYLPGYRGNTPKLSTGAFTPSPALTPQKLHLVFDGLGTAAGVGRVSATLDSMSFQRGYTGNAEDPADGLIRPNADVSFNATGELSWADTNGNGSGARGANKSWIDIWVRDYAATGELTSRVFDAGGFPRARASKQLVRDTDYDKMQDGWELGAVADFEAKYAMQFTATNKLTVFGYYSPPDYADEQRDPDSTPNQPDPQNDTDGGANMVPHKTTGDSLTPYQEYRGYILDGGGFDGGGANGHGGGHKRLSPAYKELLLEVDAMAGVPSMPTAAQLTGVLTDVARGFSNATNGAGVRVYWVVDEAAAPAVNFPSTVEARDWADEHSNPQLKEFVHLTFAGNSPPPNTYGFTINQERDGGGCFVFTSFIQTVAPVAQYGAWLANTAAHELGHAIIVAAGALGFDPEEHVTDPDGNGAIEGPGDLHYLMIRGPIRTPRTAIVFDDATRGQIDLNQKESVER